MEIYRSEQVTTANGSAVITMAQVPPNTAFAPVQRPHGEVWNVTKNYTSGFISSWNKFCFTGGYVEASLLFPGDHFISGFWPAFWLMGNLGRPGFMKSTGGVWPYSYDSCGGANTPQLITACNDTDLDRTKYGLLPNVGCGAPEIDIVEMKVPSSLNESNNWAPIPTDTPIGGGPGQKPMAFNSMTLQLGPLLHNGTTWMDPNNCCQQCCSATDPMQDGGCQGQGPLGPGMFLPQEGINAPGSPISGMYTHSTFWQGVYADGFHQTLQQMNRMCLLDNIRPGNAVQDSVSVMGTLREDYYEQHPNATYHRFGLDWRPREYIRWCAGLRGQLHCGAGPRTTAPTKWGSA
ncbi:hypothetical protein ABPG75_002313 [Micractinium tetrahymenae]